MTFNQEELIGKWFAIHIAAGLLVVQHNGEEDSWGSGELEGKAYNTNLFLGFEGILFANVFECTQKNEDGTWNNDESIEITVLGVHRVSMEKTPLEILQEKTQKIIAEYRENYEVKSFEDFKNLPVGTKFYRITSFGVNLMGYFRFMGVHPFAKDTVIFMNENNVTDIQTLYYSHFRKGTYYIRKEGLEKQSYAICKYQNHLINNTDLTKDMQEILKVSQK